MSETKATALTLYNEGEKLKDAGDYEPAIEKFLAASAEDEAYALPHLALAVTYGKVNKHEEGVRHAEIACQLEPEDPFNLTTLSTIYQRAYAANGNQEYIAKAEAAMERARVLGGL